MSPELISAIRDRIIAGQTKETIKAAVLAMGHTEVVFESAYTLALNDLEKVATDVPAVPPAALPTAYDLLTDSLSFIVKRFDTVLLVLVPGLLFFGLTYAGERVSEPLALSVAIDVLSVLAFLVYVVAIFAVMYMVIDEEGAPTYVEGLQWARKNILPLFLISILMFLVIIGGFVLFIIPGIILSLTLGFAQYALILEQQKGMSALVRSRELLRGRIWAVGLKLAAFYFYILAPLFLFVFVTMLMVIAVPALTKFSLLAELAIEVVSAALTIVGVYAMARLYRALQVGRPLTEVSSGRKGIYWFLALLGASVIVAIIALVTIFKSEITDSIIIDPEALQHEIQITHVKAQLYAYEHNDSFEGVCEVLRPTITAADTIECNDSETQWAILGETVDGRFCADTTTTGKEVNSALGERLTCLPLPEKAPQTDTTNVLDTTNEATSTQMNQ